jgi:hypothetical protein
MPRSPSDKQLVQQAWDRFSQLGGEGRWKDDLERDLKDAEHLLWAEGGLSMEARGRLRNFLATDDANQ